MNVIVYQPKELSIPDYSDNNNETTCLRLTQSMYANSSPEQTIVHRRPEES